MKRVLLLYYSQTGQTREALQQISAGLTGSMQYTVQCDLQAFSVEETFNFPWKMRPFFRIFPRSVLGRAPRMNELNLDFSTYDLIILGGQVWFLSPSLPLQSFLNSNQAQGLKGKKVIVVFTCRNLWYSGLRIVKEKLLALGSQFSGEIIVCERSPLWASFVTTPRWMLTGKKEAFLFFPEAGIKKDDFQDLKNIGYLIGQKLQDSSGDFIISKTNLDRFSLRTMDRIGRKFFEFWARLIFRLAPEVGAKQDLMLAMFRVNLVILILCLLPITKVLEIIIEKIKGRP